jgi:hypothetical protein
MLFAAFWLKAINRRFMLDRVIDFTLWISCRLRLAALALLAILAFKTAAAALDGPFDPGSTVAPIRTLDATASL